jgi:DNA-directed RNA polymerase subunit RPC12/RpoP
MIKFHCSNCKKKFGVPDDYAGRRIRCNTCNQTTIVPKPAPAVPGPQEVQIELQSPPQFDELKLSPPDDTPPTDSRPDTFGQVTHPPAALPDSTTLPRWYWPFLFPLNGTGLGMIGLFVLSRFFIWLAIFGAVYVIPIIGIVVALILSVISFIIKVYACWYTCLCVQMSAQGQIKAPDVLQHDEGGFWEMAKQLFRIIAAVGFCGLSAILYYYHYKKTDELFWGIIAAGWFFLPMMLLSSIMYDSLAGLNPFLVVISIIRVFFRYVLLVLKLSIPAGLFIITLFYSKHLGILFILPAQAILLYLAFVGAAMLGRFFLVNEERLNWCV